MQMDTDGDTSSISVWADALETYLGTDPTKACSASSANSDEPMDNWPLDMNDNQTTSGQDTGSVGGVNGAYNKLVVQGRSLLLSCGPVCGSTSTTTD